MKYIYVLFVSFFLSIISIAQTPVLIKDIYNYTNRGSIGYPPAGAANYITVRNVTYFTANDTHHGIELWKTDGTREGTVMVKDINPNGSSSPGNLTNLNDTLYFVASSNLASELWKSDGTEQGTLMVFTRPNLSGK
jgi:ELWxxDGT repeat protein